MRRVSALLPCPFCGSESQENLDAAARTGSGVVCVGCGCVGPSPYLLNMNRGRVATDGIEAWNVRAPKR